MRDFSIALPRASESVRAGLDSLTLIHPLLAMCCQHIHPPLLHGQEHLWIFIAATILAPISVTAVPLLKVRVQITANLGFNMADNCFLVLFNKLYFFRMKINGLKALPVLWGSDFVVVRDDINRVTRVVWKHARNTLCHAFQNKCANPC